MFKNAKTTRPENPIKNSMFISRLYFIWMKDIFGIGMKRSIEDQDIYESLDEHESNNLAKYFTTLWNDEQNIKKTPSLYRVLLKAYGTPLALVSALFAIAETFLCLLQPICLGGLVSYFASNQIEISKEMAYLYASGLSISSLVTAIMFHPYIFFAFQTFLKCRNGISSLIYRKILRLSKSTVFDGMNGRVINMLSNDISKLEFGIINLHDLLKGPFEIIVIGYYLYREIGKSAIFALAFLLSFIPFQIWMTKKAASFILNAAKRTDIRVKFMNEIIQGIQVIKMYAWENSFAKMVDKVRRKELKVIRGLYLIEGIINSFLTVSRISIFLSLMTYVYFGENITASKVFITTSCLLILNQSMTYFFPVTLIEQAAALISLKRIENFLLMPETKKNLKPANNNIQPERDTNKHLLGKGIHLQDVSASWTGNANSAGIFSINLEVKQNNLCTIIGLVGSGKSTLLNVIIGELEIDDGIINVNGSLSYASQESWLFDGTIKQNIVFVEEFDEARYREVCRVCALERDFQLLPFSDLTLVGERGVVLSGGQKARVSLARAVYRKADIYLLDDPLSAVDAHVGKQIFTECIQNYLKEKCVILVTHQIQYLNNVEHIVLIDNGKIDVQGNVNDIRKIRSNILSALEVPDVITEDKLNNTKRLEAQTSITSNEDEEEEEVKENLVEGSVSFQVYKNYMKSVKSGFSVLVVGIFFIISQLSLIAVDYFLAQWANWEEAKISLKLTSNITTEIEDLEIDETRTIYFIVYSVLTIVLVYVIIHRNILYFQMCLRASKNLHNNLFIGISHATMFFFNTNPSGRILNRFSKDIGAIDLRLPFTMMDATTCLMEMFSIGILVSAVNPWLLLPTGILSIIMYVLRNVYLRSSRGINRIQSINQSPVFSHVNGTIQGLSTIRACKAQMVLDDEFNKHLNNLTASTYMYKAATRAFALWLDTLSALYIVIVIMSCLLFSDNILGGDVGLIITKSLHLVGLCEWGIRQSAELENNMVSVERINEYSKLKPEPSLERTPASSIPVEWPKTGEIIFQSLNLKYSDDGPLVLKNLNFTIKPNEKIGVVGRTGAGKSSLIQAMFRLTEIDGDIEIDGINVKSVKLHDLRTKISIIPQDPVLFSGSVRTNLDPFLEKSDTDLWYALEQVQLKHVVLSLAGGLDSNISDSGSNFSMGQRQLVCLARAILKNNRILILDEATANVDSETDKLIQTTIRNTFSECTVITIAHRLHTVMDSDRILVMDGGRAVEFDSPSELLKQENGYFTRLTKHLDFST